LDHARQGVPAVAELRFRNSARGGIFGVCGDRRYRFRQAARLEAVSCQMQNAHQVAESDFSGGHEQ